MRRGVLRGAFLLGLLLAGLPGLALAQGATQGRTQGAVQGATQGATRAAPRHASLNGAHIVGYQGWFACPGDGHAARDDNWVHWFGRGQDGALAPSVELLPDTSEMAAGEGCPTTIADAEGRAVRLFSSLDPKVVDRHLRWMQEYEITGLALQRFLSQVLRPELRAPRDRVLENVQAAAEAHGRSFFIMYDLSGQQDAALPGLLADWQALAARGVLASPAYQWHRGKPVVALWGLGFQGRPLTPAAVATLVAGLRASLPGGVTIMGGVPAYWRTHDRDADGNTAWDPVLRGLDILSPWTVGRYADDAGADTYLAQSLRPDLAATAAAGQDLMPVVFPGFSWSNLMRLRGRETPANQIPRRCGAFYWHQAGNAVGAGARMLYTAMFDEVDEGTAIFKLAPAFRPAPGGTGFLALGADGCTLPPDWYLRLAREIGGGLRHGSLPDRPPVPTAASRP